MSILDEPEVINDVPSLVGADLLYVDMAGVGHVHPGVAVVAVSGCYPGGNRLIENIVSFTAARGPARHTITLTLSHPTHGFSI